jgi:hypothetical protein
LLPSGNPGSFTSVKFLASLGINCGIEFQDDRIDWDGVENVAGYIFTSEIPHGIIEPFTYLLENYNPREYLDFNIALLNTPLRFLYVDEELNIYPTRTAMLNNRKTGSGKEYLKNYPQTKEYRDLKFKWKDLFMSLNPCSTCPAFRICLGKFAGGDTDLVRCRSAFSKILEGIENYKQNQTGIRVNG